MTEPIPLVGGNFYHIYNRGNNGETIFYTVENYRYFAQLMVQHVTPVAAIHALCLLPNHFHFLSHIRTEEEQKRWRLPASVPQACHLPENWQPIPSHRGFKNLFIAYSMAFNRRYERTGSLFQKPFKRILVDSERYYTALVRYIHRHPQRHGLIADFRDWPWSSYGALVSEQPTQVPRADVLAWFSGRDAFVALHQADPDEAQIKNVIVEE